nr:DEAD/DEAH box helicase family protein [Treponema primitia]
MSNFEFLRQQNEYTLFSPAAIEAEKVYATSSAMCAVGCRKALELAVKWVYSADKNINMPYKDNIQSLIHEPSFRFAVDSKTWGKLSYIIKLGNLAVHTERAVDSGDALTALKGLFEFIDWIDYSYGSKYAERRFDEALIPKGKVVIVTKKIKETQSLLDEKDSEIKRLQKIIEDMAPQYTAGKEQHQQDRTFKADDISEFKTRKIYIDVDLKLMGWRFSGADADVIEEYEVNGMADVLDQKGYADYVLLGKDGLPLAVIEAKRSSKDANTGRKQASLYADCLERQFKRRPMIFTTNGFETYFWDNQSSPQRKVSGIFSKDNLQKLMNRRIDRKNLDEIPINPTIAGRPYQIAAIRAVGDSIKAGFRKQLLVMATGSGKTRTAAGLVDVLSRGGHVTNTLFLADRRALVKQAKDAFKNYLPDMSLCNLLSNKDDRTARIVFSTYPTILNAIDTAKNADGLKLFTPAHFDLIIVDESHRSIFKKYRAIFEYFDALTLGLTATPKTDVDRNTYEFFEMEHGVPTYAYDYETAVYTDHVLVPYYNIEVKTKFLEDGIVYDELSDEDKKRYEDDFTEDDTLPDFIPAPALNKFVFNQQTVDTVLQDLMERGIKIEGGDRVGKSIIFAQSKLHAEYVLERFNKLHPNFKGGFAQRVICDDSYSQEIIEDFKVPEKEPRIVVSVDMMDTGIDVPECVNLVFFKKVRSKTKFWQMIGRGTRICIGLECLDNKDGAYTDKRRFFIFDYCGNFEYFREHTEGFESTDTKSLSESIFSKKIRLAVCLQDSIYAGDDYQSFRNNLTAGCQSQIAALNQELVSVKLKRQYVEKYKLPSAYVFISEGDKGDIIKHLAPLVLLDDADAGGSSDEAAKRFDNFMYGMMLADIEHLPSFNYARKQLSDIALLFEKKISIPQVKANIALIKTINTDDFWDSNNILALDEVRQTLRGLMKFLVETSGPKTIITNLTDPVISWDVGEPMPPAYDFEDYRKKVNRYIEEHAASMSIHKLTHNIPLGSKDYQELERVLTIELGSREDYQREYGDTPFGLLIRKIAKLNHEAAMQAFSQFINDQSLNHNQIEFIQKVINHVEQNGYMEDLKDLTKPPFDKPISFVKLFDPKRQSQLMDIIRTIKENAVTVAA